jgi:hypothetical protein
MRAVPACSGHAARDPDGRPAAAYCYAIAGAAEALAELGDDEMRVSITASWDGRRVRRDDLTISLPLTGATVSFIDEPNEVIHAFVKVRFLQEMTFAAVRVYDGERLLASTGRIGLLGGVPLARRKEGRSRVENEVLEMFLPAKPDWKDRRGLWADFRVGSATGAVLEAKWFAMPR